MNYQALANKYRPNSFSDVVGQDITKQALTNALNADKLHQAILFTGTRGVGKTTLARIVAKCLNCEQGVSATPCNTCNSCKEIANSTFVDLIEVDAASRTKVEDTLALLTGINYPPTVGRYKVFIIDEVHMLSMHSFNALLKTLEEPPPHVKFIFATTEAKKIPVTILSRTLQFNLTKLNDDLIVDRLKNILNQEQITFETDALKAIANSATGSMRDALSLTDRAIASTNDKLTKDNVLQMLGIINPDIELELIELVVANKASELLSKVNDIKAYNPDFATILGNISSILQHIATLQMVSDANLATIYNQDILKQLAAKISPADLQVYYQMCLLGKRDLDLVVEPSGGFLMIMFRMVAFTYSDEKAVPSLQAEPSLRGGPSSQAEPSLRGASSSQAEPSLRGASSSQVEPSLRGASRRSNPDTDPGLLRYARNDSARHNDSAPRNDSARHNDSAPRNDRARHNDNSAPRNDNTPRIDDSVDKNNWSQVAPKLNLSGIAKMIVTNATMKSFNDDAITLIIGKAQAALNSTKQASAIAKAINDYYGKTIKLTIEVGEHTQDTPRIAKEKQIAAKDKELLDKVQQDKAVQDLMTTFDAKVEAVIPNEEQS